MQHSARASVSLSNTRPEQRSGPADRSHRLRQWQRKASPEVTCPCIRRSLCRATAMCNTQPGHRSAFPTLGQSSARGQPFQHSAKAALGPCAPQHSHPSVDQQRRQKKKPSVRGLTNRSNSVQVTPTLRTSHHARSTTRSS